jgi:hypothetical protein
MKIVLKKVIMVRGDAKESGCDGFELKNSSPLSRET